VSDDHSTAAPNDEGSLPAGVVGEQLFILVSDQFGHDHIKVRRSGY
jgi:hypothetical protein